MHILTHDPLAVLMKRLLIGALVLIALIVMGLGITHAGENAPSAATAQSEDSGS